MTSGGRRLNAGRKSLPAGERRIQVSFTIHPKTNEIINKVSREKGLSRSEVIDHLVSLVDDK